MDMIANGFHLSYFAISYRATIAIDYTYGMQSISGIRMPTDYCSAQSVAIIYQELIAYWLSTLTNCIKGTS
jgi:hypothetical protein